MATNKMVTTGTSIKTTVTMQFGDWNIAGAIEKDGEGKLISVLLNGFKSGENNETLANFNYNLVGENESINTNKLRKDYDLLKAIDAEIEKLAPSV